MKNRAALKSHAALYDNPIPFGVSLCMCVCVGGLVGGGGVDTGVGLTLSQSIFCCFLGNAALATITGGG